MALVLKDRVKETTTSTGTGTITLGGAAVGYQSFSVIGNGNTTYYVIADRVGVNWEVGIGTYTASGTTLARNTVIASSNAGSLVNFGAGDKDVFVTYPADRAVTTSDIQTLTNKTISGTNNTLSNIPNSATTATSANTASAIVARDASGNFSAGTVTAALSGNATTATTLASTRTIWGQNFNGSANVTGALSSVTTLSMSGQLTNTTATGTAPFVVSSTTRVANLNVATSGSADSATNIAGGGAGRIPYNTGTGATSFIAAGTAGQILQSNGTSAPSWVASPAPGVDVFYENSQTVTTNYTITSGKNAMSAGDISIASGVTVTVPSGSKWTVVG